MKGEVSVQGCKGIPPSRMRRQHAQISKARASHLSCAKLDVWDACRTPVSRCSSMLDPPLQPLQSLPAKATSNQNVPALHLEPYPIISGMWDLSPPLRCSGPMSSCLDYTSGLDC